MPTMYEIYQNHADQYHELVCAEDYEGNLPKALREMTEWQNTKVIEAGVGTGRVTRQYIEYVKSSVCFDRSPHMIDFAKKELCQFKNKITFKIADNLNLPMLFGDFDLFIEGWSFCHCAGDCSTMQEVVDVTKRLVQNSMQSLRSGSNIILIESMGTNVDSPKPPNKKLEKFYHELEETHGFRSEFIRTDYCFESNAEAVRVMGFFFGEQGNADIQRRKTGIIPEWTGIWRKTVS